MHEQQRAGGFRWIIFFAAFLILPNLALPLAARSLNLLASGLIDLDYLVVAVLALFLSRRETFLLLLLAMIADFIHAACATYLFSPSEFLNSMRFGGMLSTARAEAILGTLALALLLCALTSLAAPRPRAGKPRRLAAGVLLGLLAILLLAQARSHSPLLGGEESALARLPSANLIQRQWIYDRYERGERLSNMRAMPSATAIALGHLRDSVPAGRPAGTAGSAPGDDLPNLVQILVESWGQPKDDALRHALLAPYADPGLLARYRVLEGTMPFEGPTTSGEARELCQTHVGFNASHGSVEQMQHCLPMRLRGLGYRTLAVHGFKGAMFDREVWYPQMGFQDIWFEDRLQSVGIPECPGPFGGSCDAEVAAWISGRLAQPGQPPLFVHWVTLNSHLPVPLPAPLRNPVSCAVSAVSRDDASICSWYQLVSVVHESVRQMALQPLNRPTIYVIVGDHAPPFDRQATRDQFSRTEVPYVILLPKAQNGSLFFGN